MPKRAKIALLIESSREYGRGLLRGIAAYAQVHGRWSIYHHERALADADVTASMHFIREHACEGIQVEDLLHRVQISRSTLERRFARLLGRSPKAEILRMQLEHVKQLLTRTDYPLAKIAQLTGFRHVENLCYLFKNRTGRTPGQYRNLQSPANSQ